MPPEQAAGYLDREHQHAEEHQAEHQRPLGLHREAADERRDEQREGEHAVARRMERDAVQEHRDTRAREAHRDPDRERPERAVEGSIHQFREPRLRDPARSRRGERIRVATRDPVVEDQPTGAQVPEK